MYKNKKIAVVVPAFNESQQIGKVIRTMPDFVDLTIVIDDFSSDGMGLVVRELTKEYPRTLLIRHEVNQGVGGAIATGYKYARDNEFDVAVVMAGDGQMDPVDLPKILDPVATDLADYSKANRLIAEKSSQEIPLIRFLGNSVLSLLTKIASGYWHVSDSQTGYTAINKQALQVIDWDSMYKRYGQPNDLLVRLNVHNFRVCDVTTKPVYNVGERSKLKVRKVVFTISWLLLKRFLWRMKEKYIIRDFHPLVLFYMFGFLMFVLSFLFFIRLVYLWNIEGRAPELTVIALLFCFGSAMHSIFFAMWFDMEQNKHLR